MRMISGIYCDQSYPNTVELDKSYNFFFVHYIYNFLSRKKFNTFNILSEK